MNFMFALLIFLMFFAYISVFVWRRHITRKQGEFENKISMAGDDSYIQDTLNQHHKKKQAEKKSDDGIDADENVKEKNDWTEYEYR